MPEEYAQIVFHDYGKRVEWIGDPSWPFVVSQEFLRDIGLEMVSANFGPLEVVGEHPDRPNCRIFRIKQS